MLLKQAAFTALSQCMGLQPGESCLIITDSICKPIGECLYEVASEITEDVSLLLYPPGTQHGEEPPLEVSSAMLEYDVFLAPTSKSITHTRARRLATESGARGATLPGITEEVMIKGLCSDYGAIRSACDDLLHKLEGSENIHLIAKSGTDIEFNFGPRKWHSDHGINHNQGDFSNLPAGEVYNSPINANGIFVVDGTMMPHGLLKEPIKFKVSDGYVTSISDKNIKNQVEMAAKEVGKNAYNLAELGVGTNLNVTELIGSVLLDEKAAGTVHIAIGDDKGIGGDVEAPLHLDGIIRDPTLYVDGVEINLPSSSS
tara:strand:- start:19665 stop:20609 length:945 start_codon:yes stop_codon:yes gene_type:complete